VFGQLHIFPVLSADYSDGNANANFQAEVVLMALHLGLLLWFSSSPSICHKCPGGIMVCSLGAVMLLATPSTSVAAQATMGDVTINLPVPAGHCELMESDPSDTRMLTLNRDVLKKGGNKLLSMSADCGQLNDWRVGKRQLLDDYAQYQTSISTIDTAPAATIEQTCTFLRNEGRKVVAQKMPDIKARVEAAVEKLKVNETSYIGVLAEDPNACYAGIIQQLHTEVGTDKTQLTLFAVTIVKSRAIYVYRMGIYGANSIDPTLGKLKGDVAALHTANR
jgi:hypothetical protein